jgi:hypothetical protein
VRSGGRAKSGERVQCVVAERVGCGDDLVAGLDGDGVVATEVFTNLPMIRLVDCSTSRETAGRPSQW